MKRTGNGKYMSRYKKLILLLKIFKDDYLNIITMYLGINNKCKNKIYQHSTMDGRGEVEAYCGKILTIYMKLYNII